MSSQRNSFAVWLIKIDKYNGVGVIDEQYKQRKYLEGSECPNWICCWSNGNITNKQKWTKGSATVLKEDEMVTVRVNFTKGIINWLVGGSVRATAKNELLMEKTIRWVPYVWIRQKSAVAIPG